jgi:hypothetical protein
MQKKKPDYGLDAPGVVRGLLFGAPALFAVGYSFLEWATPRNIGPVIGISYSMVYCGIVGLNAFFESSFGRKAFARSRVAARTVPNDSPDSLSG